MLGNNYGNAIIPSPVGKFALLMEEANSLNTNDVMSQEPQSPRTLQRIREQNILIENDVSERHDHDPKFGVPASSQGSHKRGSPGEINLAPANEAIIFPAGGNITRTPNDISNASLETLHDNFVVQKGVLSLVNVNLGANTEIGEYSKAVNNQKIVSQSDMVQKNSKEELPETKPRTSFSYNEDGYVNLIAPREFLTEARKQWDPSCIGHFIGGSFDFKFVKDRAPSMWKRKGI